jgi:P27 family predicted phage terminase small subunit
MLSASGLLTSGDRAALAAYCSAWSRWVTAEERIQISGLVIIASKSGYPIPNPFVGIANTALDQMRKFLIEFGMTPASRSRINLIEDTTPKGDAFQAFMSSIGASDLDVTHDDTDPQLRSASN